MAKYCLLLWLLADASCAAMYEWVDKDGRRHFSDRKPVSDVSFHIRENDEGEGLSIYRSEIKSRQWRSLTESRRSGRGSAVARRRAAQKEREEQRCASYRQRLKKIQNTLRRGYREPRGNRLRQQRHAILLRYQQDC